MFNTKEELAAYLHTRIRGDEISTDEEARAKQLGLVVLFGYSDDYAKFRGAIHDEIGCYDGGTLKVNHLGIMLQPDRDEREVLERFGVLDQVTSGGQEIEAVWHEKGDFCWTYDTKLPHAVFAIMEDGNPFCQGIVFDLPKAL